MFCSNCGEKIGLKKTCKKCGYKLGKGKGHCVYCGRLIDKEADICFNCGQKKYKGRFNVFKYILFIVFTLTTLFCFYTYLQTKLIGDLVISIGFLVITINLLPLWNIIIKVKLVNKKKARILINIIKTIFIPMIAIIIIGYGFIISPYSWTDEDASNFAIENYFNTKLKNPESLQIHDYDVTYSNDEIDNEITIWVKYDYSAQNGLGGFNRDNVTVTLLYNNKNNTFTFVNAK